MTARTRILGCYLFDIFPDNPDDSTATGTRNLRASLERVRQTKTADVMAVQQYDIRPPDSEGGAFEERYWSPVNSPVCDADGELAYIIHRVEDVTEFIRLKRQDSEQARRTEVLQDRAERMEAEIFARAQQLQDVNRQLRAANAELAEQAVERTRLSDRLQRLDQLKTQFFANVSHELRTPLTLILGPVEQMLSAADVPDAWTRPLRVIRRNARTLVRHVNDLLNVARLDAGRLQPRYADLDIARLVREAAANFDGVAQQREITYDITTPARLDAEVDPDKIVRVVLNLLSNAFKFTPPHGRVTCQLHAGRGPKAEWINLEVTDTGPGIPVEFRDAVFERFFQAEQSAIRRFDGTGLGLTIVKDFVDLHGGRITLTEAYGGGAAFLIQLPRHAPRGVSVGGDAHLLRPSSAAAELYVPDVSVPFVPAPDTPDRPERPDEAAGSIVLVVEDNVDMNRFIAAALGSEYVVRTAASGQEALDRALKETPDLIVTDLTMPGMSGGDLLTALRRSSSLSGVPVLVLTARADDDGR